MKILICTTAVLALMTGAALAQDEPVAVAPEVGAAAPQSAEPTNPVEVAEPAPAETVAETESVTQAVPAPAEPAVEQAVAAADEPQIDPNVYQVLRPGDRQMSCQALSAEANSLNAQLLAAAKEEQKRKGRSRVARGAAGAATTTGVRTAARFGLRNALGALGPVGAIAAIAATEVAADAAGAAVASSGPANDVEGTKPEQQRMNHLLSLYREKGC